MVVFNFAADFEGHAGARRIASWLTPYEGAMPDTYGMSCEDLAALMNECRERANAT